MIEKALESLRNINIHIKFIKKYVDDIFLIAKRDHIQQILKTFNSIDDILRFTIEVENKNQLPFLDVLVMKEDDKTLITKWYSKPTSSNRLLNYLSMHPKYMKLNIAKSFATRVFGLTNIKFKKEAISKVDSILKLNNYPTEIVTKTIKKALYISYYQQKTPNTAPPAITVSAPSPSPDDDDVESTFVGYRSLGYVANLSEPLARKLKARVDCKVAFKSQRPLRQIFTKTKDKISNLNKSSAVYQVSCDCGQKYIGQSGRRISERMKEHKDNIRLKSPKSALAKHGLIEGHHFSFEEKDIKILTQESHRKKREFKESCLIFQNKNNTVNLRTDTRFIDKNYHTLLSPTKLTRRTRDQSPN